MDMTSQHSKLEQSGLRKKTVTNTNTPTCTTPTVTHQGSSSRRFCPHSHQCRHTVGHSSSKEGQSKEAGSYSLSCMPSMARSAGQDSCSHLHHPGNPQCHHTTIEMGHTLHSRNTESSQDCMQVPLERNSQLVRVTSVDVYVWFQYITVSLKTSTFQCLSLFLRFTV